MDGHTSLVGTVFATTGGSRTAWSSKDVVASGCRTDDRVVVVIGMTNGGERAQKAQMGAARRTAFGVTGRSVRARMGLRESRETR